ncbi:MAG TPA: 16S rRNA (guanine(966)-N(2))-methyltransferase RsmD [Candidatus Dormibacteraeota bacterium]|jgi:16S rRNA (guanine966-N2)-methyltransferase|nr:16S rRNA (guanine(966)-N(2))-methyltransferase RsmD [Candidatus Dormibacteraeota bacterium]
MRIIAGTYRSRILKSLKGHALRPTSDWLRETLFNILGPAVVDSRFLDLYAGTGAVGIEALSRGAVNVVFVENHPAAAKLIRENLASLKIESGAHMIASDAAQALAKLAMRPREPFGFVFLDPPYAAEREYEITLNALGSSTLLSSGSIVIAEHRKSFELAESFGQLQRYRILKQGDAALSFFRMS